MTASGDRRSRAPWRCPVCGSQRTADDDFCGRCGSPRPVPDETGTGSQESVPPEDAAKGRFPVMRALVLNGIVIGAVILVFLLGRRDGGPTTVTFVPGLWRCDGTERAWIASVPASAIDVRLDWMTGGPAGEVHATSTTSRIALEAYRQADGTFRVSSTDTDAPECGLDAGTYTLAIRDAASNALLASGTVEMAPAR